MPGITPFYALLRLNKVLARGGGSDCGLLEYQPPYRCGPLRRAGPTAEVSARFCLHRKGLHNIHLRFMVASLTSGELGDVGKQQKQKPNNMKINKLAMAMVCGGLMAAMVAGCAITGTGGGSVVAKAKLSKSEAEKIALTKAPGGTVKEGELEMESGVLIWSFDIATPGSKNITEVAVNAVTGKIVAVDVETPEDQAKEKAEDAKKKN